MKRGNGFFKFILSLTLVFALQLTLQAVSGDDSPLTSKDFKKLIKNTFVRDDVATTFEFYAGQNCDGFSNTDINKAKQILDDIFQATWGLN